jgi:SAM-dependent methyltransferase
MRPEGPVNDGRTKSPGIEGEGRMPEPCTSVVWHDVECGAYVEDLALWHGLADAYGDPILDVGAGTGRVTLPLARRGHRVVALDRDADLLAALRDRAGDTPVETVAADAREFDLGEGRFALVLVPMQTLQLLGGHEGREAFLRCVHRCLKPGGVLAAALADALEGFDDEHTEMPLPDMREIDGTVYHSQVIAVRAWPEATRIERIRQTVDLAGHRSSEGDIVTLDRVDAATVAEEAAELGFATLPARRIDQTDVYVGSEVVVLCRR